MADENIKPEISEDGEAYIITYSGLNGKKDVITQVSCVGDPVAVLNVSQMYPGIFTQAKTLEFNFLTQSGDYWEFAPDGTKEEQIHHIPLENGMAEKGLTGKRTVTDKRGRTHEETATIPKTQTELLMLALEKAIRDVPGLKISLPPEFSALRQVPQKDAVVEKAPEGGVTVAKDIKRDAAGDYVITYRGLNRPDDVIQVMTFLRPGENYLIVKQMHPGTDTKAYMLDFDIKQGVMCCSRYPSNGKKGVEIRGTKIQEGMAEDDIVGMVDRAIVRVTKEELAPLFKALELAMKDAPELAERLPPAFNKLRLASTVSASAGRNPADYNFHIKKPVQDHGDSSGVVTFEGTAGRGEIIVSGQLHRGSQGEPCIEVIQERQGSSKPLFEFKFALERGVIEYVHYGKHGSEPSMRIVIPTKGCFEGGMLIGKGTSDSVRGNVQSIPVPEADRDLLIAVLRAAIVHLPQLKDHLPELPEPKASAASSAKDDTSELPKPVVLPPEVKPQPDGPYKGAPMRVFTARRADEIIALGEERDRPDGSLCSKLELEADGSGRKTFYYKTPGAPKQRSVVKFGSAELDNRLVIESIDDGGVARRQLQLLEALALKPGNRIILDFSLHPPKISEQDGNFIVAAHELATKQGKRIELAGLTERGNPEQTAIAIALDNVNKLAGKKIKRLPPEGSVCLAIHDIHKVPISRTDYTEEGAVCYHEKFADSGDLKGMFEDESEKNPIKVRRPLDDERPEKSKEFTKEIVVQSEKGERLRRVSYSREKDKEPVELGYEEFRADNTLYSQAKWDEKGGGTLTVFYPPTPDPRKPGERPSEVKRTVFTFSDANFAEINNKILIKPIKPDEKYELPLVEAMEMAGKPDIRDIMLDFSACKFISDKEIELVKQASKLGKKLKLVGMSDRLGEQGFIDRELAKVYGLDRLPKSHAINPAIHALGKVVARREDFKLDGQEHPYYMEEYDAKTHAFTKAFEPSTAKSMREAKKRGFDDDLPAQSRGR